jgi:hypothetical protein
MTGLVMTVAAGEGVRFPAAPFNCTVWPSASGSPSYANAEIIRVTVKVGDIFTIVRAQEGTVAIAISAGDFIANTTTVKVFTDIENSVIQAISAAGGAATASMVQFDNSPTVSFGRAGQTITASAAGGGAGSINFSAGTLSQNLASIVFSDSNGISFGLNAGTLTASHNGITSQTVQPVAASASNGSFLFSTLSFTNASNVTFGTSAGGIIFASVAAPVAQSTQPVAASASNGSFLFSTLGFSNANGVTFGTSAGSIVSASVAAQTVQPVNASAPNGSFNFSTIIFSNSNNVSWSTTAGSGIVASVTVASTQASVVFGAVGSTNTGSQFIFSNSNKISFGLNASTFTASFDPINIGMSTNGNTAGTTGTFDGGGLQYVFAGVSGITLSQSSNVSSVTLSIVGPGGVGTLQDWANMNPVQSMALITNVTATGVTQRPIFFPLDIDGHLIWNRAQIEVSQVTNSQRNLFTCQFAIYTFANSTSINLLATLQNVFDVSSASSVSFTGIRRYFLQGIQTVGSSLTPGQYVGMIYFSNTATSGMNFSLRGAATIDPQLGFVGSGTNNLSTANLTTIQLRQFLGRYTATTASPPAAVGLSNISVGTLQAWPYLLLQKT